MAESYDPSFRRAQVICGYDPRTGTAGPTHEMGKFLPARGSVRAARFVDPYLEVEITQNEGPDGKPAVRSLVQQGFDAVSIEIDDKTELGPETWYLRAVALVSGEKPGTPGIPSLRDAFRTLEEWGLDDGLPFIEIPLPAMGLDGQLQPRFYRTLAECELSCIDPSATPEDGPPAEEEPTMTPEELGAAFTRTLSEQLPGAMAAAVKPLQEELATLRTELATSRAEVLALSGDTALARLDSRIDACLNSQRIAPAEVEHLKATVRALPAEGDARENFLKAYEARSSRRRLADPLRLAEAEGEDLSGMDLRTLTTPTGMAVDPEALDLHLRTLKECGGDMTKYAAAAERLFAQGGAN